MSESDVDDYMEYVSAISLSSQAYYQGIKINKNIEWARGGIQSVFTELLTRDIDNFVFSVDIVFTPDLYQCICKVHLFYIEEVLYIEFKLKELSDRSNMSNKIDKKYTGYYASKDGSMDAQVVIDKFDLSWNRANVLKYIVRAGKKDPSKEIEDLEKAIQYLNFEIARIKGE